MYDFFFYVNLVLILGLGFLSFKTADNFFDGVVRTMLSVMMVLSANLTISLVFILYIAFSGVVLLAFLGLAAVLFGSAVYVYLKSLEFI